MHVLHTHTHTHNIPVQKKRQKYFTFLSDIINIYPIYITNHHNQITNDEKKFVNIFFFILHIALHYYIQKIQSFGTYDALSGVVN